MKYLVSLLMSLFMISSVYADYRLIVPQNPGGGTSVWASVIQPHLEKFLGEKVIIEHIPGANDVPGFNKFHNELQKDPKVIMVAHGGNAESFLTDKVDYDYKYYTPIALVNLNIVVSRLKDFDPYKDPIKFAHTSGRRPDAMAIALLVCGPKNTTQEYIDCFTKHVTYVKGMSGNEVRLAFLRADLNTHRETFVAHKKHIASNTQFTGWFEQGLLDLKTGKLVRDPNFPDVQFFNEVYKARWGKEPSGNFYDAYVLYRNYRDVLQKSLWVGKNNPNADKIQQAILKMLADPEAKKAIIEDGGDYQWFVGADMQKAYNIIRGQLTEDKLKAIVEFNNKALGFKSELKTELLK